MPKITTTFYKTADFEHPPSKQYSNSTTAFTGSNAQTIPPSEYSFGFNIPLDSLWSHQPDSVEMLKIEADVHYKNLYGSPPIIISTSKSASDFWYPHNLPKTIDPDRWGFGFTSKTIHRQQHSSGHVGIYIWNSTDFPITIDDFRLRISY